MKKKLIILLSLIVLVTIVISCKKEEQKPILPTVEVNQNQNGMAVLLVVGQTLKIDLSNPGDGGYQFDGPEYDSSTLNFVGHTHVSPTNENPGGFGSDTFEFTALNRGNTTVVITATRPFNKTITYTVYSPAVSISK